MAGEKFFLGRQPILDRTQQIVGFELLFRSAESLLAANFLDVQVASASVIVNASTWLRSRGTGHSQARTSHRNATTVPARMAPSPSSSSVVACWTSSAAGVSTRHTTHSTHMARTERRREGRQDTADSATRPPCSSG